MNSDKRVLQLYQILYSIFDSVNTIPPVDLFLSSISLLFNLSSITVTQYNEDENQLRVIVFLFNE